METTKESFVEKANEVGIKEAQESDGDGIKFILRDETEITLTLTGEHCKPKKLSEEEEQFLAEVQNEITDEQWKAANILLSSDSIPKTVTDKCKLLGISRPTWYKWRKDSAWLRTLNKISKHRVGSNILDIDQGQLEKALAGDTQSAKYCRQDVLGLRNTQNTVNQATQVVLHINPDA